MTKRTASPTVRDNADDRRLATALGVDVKSQGIYTSFKETSAFQLRRNTDATTEFLENEPEEGSIEHQRWRLACFLETTSMRCAISHPT